MALSRKHITDWKTFKDEDAAKAWKAERQEATGKLYSEVSHIGDVYFAGYAEPGELFVKAIAESAKHFNLEVPLSGDYIIGNNWASCH